MDIFKISDGFDRTAPRLRLGGDISAWRSAVRGYSVGKLVAQQYMGGRKWKDILWTGVVDVLLISERVRRLLEQAGASGWGTYAVDVLSTTGDEIPGYYGLSVTGRYIGRIDFDRRESALVYRSSASGKAMPWFQGLQFDQKAWDRSDVFMDTEGTGRIFITEKVATLFRHAKVSNCRLLHIDDVDMLAAASDIV